MDCCFVVDFWSVLIHNLPELVPPFFPTVSLLQDTSILHYCLRAYSQYSFTDSSEVDFFCLLFGLTPALCT